MTGDEPVLVYSEHATDDNGVPYVELVTDDDSEYLSISEGYSVRFYPRTVCVMSVVSGDDSSEPWIHTRLAWRGPREEFNWPELWARLDDDYRAEENDAQELSCLIAGAYP